MPLSRGSAQVTIAIFGFGGPLRLASYEAAAVALAARASSIIDMVCFPFFQTRGSRYARSAGYSITKKVSRR
jgi:hypothetical protein